MLFLFAIMFYLLTLACGLYWWPCWWCFGLKWGMIELWQSRFRDSIRTTVANVPDIQYPYHCQYYTAILSWRVVSRNRRWFSMYTNIYSERLMSAVIVEYLSVLSHSKWRVIWHSGARRRKFSHLCSVDVCCWRFSVWFGSFIMSGEKKFTDYYKLDNSVDFDEKRKISSELTYTSEEVGSKIYFCNITCTRLK